MNVRVEPEFLIPGVQHSEEADLRAKMARIACYPEQSLGAGAKQQTIDDFRVEQRHRNQLMWQRENDMDVAHRQQFRTARL